MRERLHRWDDAVARCEKTLVAVMLSVMILFALLQVILRNAFATGVSWGDPLVRNLVLWVGFIGAAMATKEGKHINLDLISRFFAQERLWLGKAAVHLFSIVVCAVLCYASVIFVLNEARSGAVTFLKVPVWIPELVIPATFGLMTVRFCLAFVEGVANRTGSACGDGGLNLP